MILSGGAYLLRPRFRRTGFAQRTVFAAQTVQNRNRIDRRDPIEDLPALTAACDDPGQTHLVQMLRNRALRTGDSGDDLADRRFAMQIEALEYPQPQSTGLSMAGLMNPAITSSPSALCGNVDSLSGDLQRRLVGEEPAVLQLRGDLPKNFRNSVEKFKAFP